MSGVYNTLSREQQIRIQALHAAVAHSVDVHTQPRSAQAVITMATRFEKYIIQGEER